MQKQEEGKPHGLLMLQTLSALWLFPILEIWLWYQVMGHFPHSRQGREHDRGRFQDHHLQGCPLLVPDCGEGVLSRGGEKLAAYCILGCGNMLFALLPVYSL